MTTGALQKVEGFVLGKLPSKKGTRFTLRRRDNSEEVKVITFKEFDNDFIGKVVVFDGLWNDTFKNYEAKTDITVGSVQQLTGLNEGGQDIVEPAPAKRGRPAKAEVSGREEFRKEAEASVVTNLKSAVAIAKKLKFEATVSDLVAIADLTGRTLTAIFMDHSKDRRMASFKK